MRRPRGSGHATAARATGRPPIAAGPATISMGDRVAALVDTNILVYRFDPRFPDKQRIAAAVLREGVARQSIRIPHQAIVEFVAAVSRPLKQSRPLMALHEACEEA